MPVFEFECGCGKRFADLVGMTADSGTACPGCHSTDVRKLVSRATFKIPAHMSDEGIAATSRQREWLKTPEAKAMDLQRSASVDDDEPEREVSLASETGPTADELFHQYKNGGMPSDISFEEMRDRAGIKDDADDDSVMDTLDANAQAEGMVMAA